MNNPGVAQLVSSAKVREAGRGRMHQYPARNSGQVVRDTAGSLPAAKEHHPDKVEAGGSSPSPRTHFYTHELLGRPECPYIERWVFDFRWFSVRIHHWLASDDQRHPHDHPWSYLSIVFRGSYVERMASGDRVRRAGSIRWYPALHQHCVAVPKSCWTLLITGPEVRKFGFWVNGKFVRRNKYHFRFGKHPCDALSESQKTLQSQEKTHAFI